MSNGWCIHISKATLNTKLGFCILDQHIRTHTHILYIMCVSGREKNAEVKNEPLFSTTTTQFPIESYSLQIHPINISMHKTRTRSICDLNMKEENRRGEVCVMEHKREIVKSTHRISATNTQFIGSWHSGIPKAISIILQMVQTWIIQHIFTWTLQ